MSEEIIKSDGQQKRVTVYSNADKPDVQNVVVQDGPLTKDFTELGVCKAKKVPDYVAK